MKKGEIITRIKKNLDLSNFSTIRSNGFNREINGPIYADKENLYVYYFPVQDEWMTLKDPAINFLFIIDLNKDKVEFLKNSILVNKRKANQSFAIFTYRNTYKENDIV